MNKVLIFLIIVLSSTLMTQGQIENEIESYVDSTEITVNNGRKYILQKITEKDYPKVKEIYTYLLLETLSTNYKAFRYSEDVYINMLIGDWNNVSALMIQYFEKSRALTYPDSYQIIHFLYDHVEANINELQADFDKQHFDDETTQIINTVLYLIKVGNPDKEYYSRIKKFKSHYKKSKYDDFIKYYLPGTIVSSAFAFSMGSGIAIPTNKLSNYFNPNAIFSGSMDVNINKIHTSLFLIGWDLPIKKEFTGIVGLDTMYFKKPERFSYITWGLRSGYFIWQNSKFHLAPHLGIGGSHITSTRYDEEDEEDEAKEEYKMLNSFTGAIGLNLEYKLIKFATNSYYGYPSYLSLKLDAGYLHFFKTVSPQFKGDIPFATLGISFGMGDF